MEKKIEKQRKAIKKLAHILVHSKFHAVTLSSRMETVYNGDCVSFPGVIIEQALAGAMDDYVLGTKHIAKKEWNEINGLVKEGELPVYRSHLKCEGRIEIMSDKNTDINELIGQIELELEKINSNEAK